MVDHDVTIIWLGTSRQPVKGFIVPTSTPGYSAKRMEASRRADRADADIVLSDVVVPGGQPPASQSFRETAAVLRLTRRGGWAAVGNAVGAYEAAVSMPVSASSSSERSEAQLIMNSSRRASAHHLVDRWSARLRHVDEGCSATNTRAG